MAVVKTPKKKLTSVQKIGLGVAIGVVLIAVIVACFFMFRHKEEPKVKKVTEKEFQVKTGYDVRLKETIQNDNYVHNKGDIYKGYKYNDSYYLTINQSGVYTYTDEFPGDKLLWTKEQNGKVTTQELTTGDKLLNVVIDDGSPFLTENGHTYIVVYEKEGNADLGYTGNATVYEVKESGKLVKQYETRGHFYSFGLDKKSGKYILSEKVFINVQNGYPQELMSYKIKSYELDDNNWKLVDEKTVNPANNTENK